MIAESTRALHSRRTRWRGVVGAAAATLDTRPIAVENGDGRNRVREFALMPLPEFNEYGDLPEGNHLASLVEVVGRFGSGSAQRAAVTDRLRRIYQLAVASGHLDRLVIFGS